MKKAILVAIIGALSLSVNAGDWGGGKSVAPPAKGPIAGCPDTSGEVTVGYATDRILHGARLARDTVWLDVNYTFESVVPLTLGVSHYNNINAFVPVPLSDETDVYLAAQVAEVAGMSVTLDYTHRFFSGFGSFGELGLTLRKDIGFADLILSTDYGINAFGSDGWAHRAGIEKVIDISDSMGLVLGAGVGYHDNYFFKAANPSSGWSHYYLTASLPIELNCAATLTPYIGFNGVQQWNEFNGQGDALHAGISLSVKF